MERYRKITDETERSGDRTAERYKMNPWRNMKYGNYLAQGTEGYGNVDRKTHERAMERLVMTRWRNKEKTDRQDREVDTRSEGFRKLL